VTPPDPHTLGALPHPRETEWRGREGGEEEGEKGDRGERVREGVKGREEIIHLLLPQPLTAIAAHTCLQCMCSDSGRQQYHLRHGSSSSREHRVSTLRYVEQIINAAFTPGHVSPGNMCPGRATCIRIHYVDGHMSPDTCCSFGIHVDCISAT